MCRSCQEPCSQRDGKVAALMRTRDLFPGSNNMFSGLWGLGGLGLLVEPRPGRWCRGLVQQARGCTLHPQPVPELVSKPAHPAS